MGYLFMLWLVSLCLPGGNAVIYREFRIPLPFKHEEYHIGHLWTTAMWGILNSGGGEGVEVVTNEPAEIEEMGKVQFTHKIFHVSSKVPKVIRMLAPKGSLEIHEESWNAFPTVKTVMSNPDYMKDGFHVTTYSRYVEGTDCNNNSIFDYDGKRDVVHIDIVEDPVSSEDYKEAEDPTKCRSENLSFGWKENDVRMCAYKLVEVQFKWFGLQGTVESRIQKVAPRIFRLLHRQMFCWMDEWAAYSMSEIREYEAWAKDEMDKIRSEGESRGVSEQ